MREKYVLEVDTSTPHRFENESFVVYSGGRATLLFLPFPATIEAESDYVMVLTDPRMKEMLQPKML